MSALLVVATIAGGLSTWATLALIFKCRIGSHVVMCEPTQKPSEMIFSCVRTGCNFKKTIDLGDNW